MEILKYANELVDFKDKSGFLRENVPEREAVEIFGLDKALLEGFKQKLETEKKVIELNKQRNQELSALTVSLIVNGKEIVLDADKESQDNIKTAILALNDGESTIWITADNQQVELTKEQLKEG